MKLHFTGEYQYIPKQLLKKCSYHEFIDPNTNKVSYIRYVQQGAYYPRFHIYLELEAAKDSGPIKKVRGLEPQGFTLNLHLDQKQASYKGTNMHGGEYEGEVVEQEGRRIERMIESLTFGRRK